LGVQKEAVRYEAAMAKPAPRDSRIKPT
jgi:hypothetical protein